MRYPVTAVVMVAVLLSVFTGACGSGDADSEVTPLESDYVLTVFELSGSSSGPCQAFRRLSSRSLGDSSWRVSFPKRVQLFSVLDCEQSGGAVLHESTGRTTSWEGNNLGWDLFSKRTTAGGSVAVISGHGEGEIGFGRRDGERIVSLELEIKHQSGVLSVDETVHFEGRFSPQAVLFFSRRLEERDSAPILCLAIEVL